MFWPSFNSALLTLPHERKNGVFNTYYALAVSAVSAISLSALTHPQGKISMVRKGAALGSTYVFTPAPPLRPQPLGVGGGPLSAVSWSPGESSSL